MVGVIMEATTKQLAAVVEPPSTKAKVTGDSTAAVEPPPSTGT
jgi:hypothetical protein